METVRSVIEQNGGRVVMDVDEAATKRRFTPVPESSPAKHHEYRPAQDRGRIYL
jgi:hypothetical protein